MRKQCLSTPNVKQNCFITICVQSAKWHMITISQWNGIITFSRSVVVQTRIISIRRMTTAVGTKRTSDLASSRRLPSKRSCNQNGYHLVMVLALKKFPKNSPAPAIRLIKPHYANASYVWIVIDSEIGALGNIRHLWPTQESSLRTGIMYMILC